MTLVQLGTPKKTTGQTNNKEANIFEQGASARSAKHCTRASVAFHSANTPVESRTIRASLPGDTTRTRDFPGKM